MMNRRQLFVCVSLSIGSVLSAAPGPAAKSLQDMTGPWQLFLDDHLVAARSNVVRSYHPFKKRAAGPVLVVERPWEANTAKVTAVLPQADGSGFRMYYSAWSGDPKIKKGGGSHMCLATSKDGITWEKPNLGLYAWLDEDTGKTSKDNNMVPGCPQWIMHTPWDPDPSRQYRGAGSGYHAYSSPDGIHWKKDSTEPIVSGGDTSHFYWDPHTRRFRCNVKGGGNGKVSGDVSGMRRRTVGFSETDDLLHFPPLRMVMAPDDIDDLWCMPGSVQRTHFYACPVLPYETMYIGLVQIDRAAEPEGYFHGPLWLELVSSRDGIHWNRVEPDTGLHSATALRSTSRPPVLDIGKFRAFDDGMVIAPPPILVGDELRLYYSGYDDLHDLLPYHSAIGLATLRKDGFASLDAGEAPGEILTKPFAAAAGVMQINFSASRGSVRVELLSQDGKVLPGYARTDCTPLTGNQIRQAVSWSAHTELPGGDAPVRFRFLLERARLYSFMPGEQARLIDEELAPPLQALYTFDGDTESWADALGADGLQPLRNLGTCTIDHKKPDPASGKHSLVVGSEWRPWNRVEILGTSDLGRHFTLAAKVKSRKNKVARLFSAYRGNYPVNTSELIFDFDPSGRLTSGLRLICKGIPVESENVTFTDGKYHHLAVVYNDGVVSFYLDGKPVGEQWIPGGDPVKLARNLLIGEDAEMGSDEQLQGNVDDVLVYGKALSAADINALSEKGAAAFFKLTAK